MRILNREVARSEKGYSATNPLILVDMQIRHLPRYPPGPAKNPLNNAYILHVHQVHIMYGKIDRNHAKSIETMDNSMKTMEEMMKTLGKSMNTMEKPAKTMEKSMNSANGTF